LTDQQADKFTGFSPGTFSFLRDLRANNNKAWFEAHRDDYHDSLLNPLRCLVVDLGEHMLTIDPQLEVTPAVDKAISRLHRDTRFSKDKSPYKSRMWIVFRRPGRDWKTAPAYFFEISPETYRYGMGFYSATKNTMDRLRDRIDNRTEEFLQAIAFYARQNTFILRGEQYKRILNPDQPEDLRTWYQRKNLYLGCSQKVDSRLYSRKLIDDLASDFSLLASFYHYLWEITLASL